MYEFEDVKIRKFEYRDIEKKIEWINNPDNNKYLHFDLPLEYNKTCKWFKKASIDEKRYDAIIEYNDIPVGIVGLTNIDFKNKKCEEYITVGEAGFKRKGIATKAGILICLYAFKILSLNKIVAHVEYGNPSLYLHLNIGFEIEGFLKKDLFVNDKFVDRFIMGMNKKNLYLPETVKFVVD